MKLNINIDLDSKALMLTLEPQDKKLSFAQKEDIVYSIEQALNKDFVELKPIYWGR